MNEQNSKEVEKPMVETPRPDRGEVAQQIVMVDVAHINVPKERVTSVWDPQIESEFEASIKAKGILEPLQLLEIDGDLWLTDGLHRLTIAEKLGMPKVPAIIKKGALEDLLIENLIRNRQRGKSNPAQEADVLDYLVRVRGFPLETASKQLGFTIDWAKKLLKISTLPEEIKDHLKRGQLPVTGAFYIADLPTPQDQLSVAKDAVTYGYTVYQIKSRVGYLLNPDREPEQGEVAFTSNGRPTIIPIRCRYCAKELPPTGRQYVWICSECEQEAAELLTRYYEALKQQQQQTPQNNP